MKLLILSFILLIIADVSLSQPSQSQCFTSSNLLTGFTADYLTFSINMTTLQNDGTAVQASYGSTGYISVDFQNQVMVKNGKVIFNIEKSYNFAEYTYGINSTQYILFNGVCYINKFNYKFPSSFQATFDSQTVMGGNINISDYTVIEPNPSNDITQDLGVDDNCNFITLGKLRKDGFGFSLTNFYYYYPNTHNPEMYACENPKPLPSEYTHAFMFGSFI